MRSSNSVSREYDSFNPSHQAIYRPLTVVGWKPYRMTLLQRCGRFGRTIMESVLIFAFRGLPSAFMKALGTAASWTGTRIHKPGMATVNAVAAKVDSGRRAGTTTQSLRL